MGPFMKRIETTRTTLVRQFIVFLLISVPLHAGWATADTSDIPLSEIKKSPKLPEKRVVRTLQTPKVTAEKQLPKIPKVRSPQPASWTLLKSIQVTSDGIRLEIDDVRNKIVLIREPRNRRLIIALTGVKFEPELSKVVLNRYGFNTARLGHHSDGTWVVIHTSESDEPLFDVIQDGGGITLKTAPAVRTAPPVVRSGQTILLSREVLTTATTHKLIPVDFVEKPLVDQLGTEPQEMAPVTPPEPRQPPDPKLPMVIDHDPYSYVVPGRSVVIRAIISGIHEVKTAYCTIRSADTDKTVLVQMTKETGTMYTYTARLPEATPASRYLRYRITAIDSNDTKAPTARANAS